MKTCALLLLAALFHCSAALAWSRPGHMITAAIVYQELREQDPKVLEHIIALAERHPDRGAFEVAAGRPGRRTRPAHLSGIRTLGRRHARQHS